MPDLTFKPIIVPIDQPNKAGALKLAAQLDPALCRVKVGKELFTAEGPAIILALQALGFEVFADLKFHDIPNTVAGAVKAVAKLGVWMLNVHASGGSAMLHAAREALDQVQLPAPQRPLLIGVTVLTSLSDADLRAIGFAQSAAHTALALGGLVQAAGLDGVVCSAAEASAMRAAYGKNFKLVTPGIRLPDDPVGDQQRVLTPLAAMAEGSDYLVIGRPISQAPNPGEKLRTLHAQLQQAALAPMPHTL